MLPGKKYRPEDFLKILQRRFWFLILPFAIVSAGVAVYARTLPTYFRAEATILVAPQMVSSSVVRSSITSSAEERVQSIASQLLTRSRLERIVNELNLYGAERRTGIMEDIIDGMRARVSITPPGRGDSFKVAFSGSDAQEVAQVANKLANVFVEESVKDRTNFAEATTQFLDVTLDEGRRQLMDIERRIGDYKRAHGGELPAQLGSNIQARQSAAMELQSLQESMNLDAQRRAAYERNIVELESAPLDIVTPATALPEASAGGAPGAPRSARQQLEAARNQLAIYQAQKLTDAHPKVKTIKQIIADLIEKADAEELNAPVSSAALNPVAAAEAGRKKKLDGWRAEMEQIDANLGKKQAAEKELRATLAELQRRIEAAPMRDSELVDLSRDYDLYRNMYSMYRGKQEDAKISANLERRNAAESFRVLDAARAPTKPVSNRLQVTLMGMAVGFGLGLALVVLLEYLDRSFRSDEEVTSVLALPVLAVVPLMMAAPDRKRKMRRRVLLGMGLGSTVMVCLTVFAWAFFK